MCSRSKLLVRHLLQSWVLDPWSPGAMPATVATVQQIQASRFAFPAILGDGSEVTWGKAGYGGDSSAVQEQLRNAQQIQASAGAFAAILDDGAVVTWGSADFGGDSSAVQEQLKNVQQIQASFFRLLQSWMMELWSPGERPTLVATLLPSRSS